VTRLVAALEARLETRLLQRTTRSVTLTDAGARYLDRARRILSDVAEAEGLAQADRRESAGHFVVAAPQLFGRLQVGPIQLVYPTHRLLSAKVRAFAERVVTTCDWEFAGSPSREGRGEPGSQE
jgi:hypothetical protein